MREGGVWSSQKERRRRIREIKKQAFQSQHLHGREWSRLPAPLPTTAANKYSKKKRGASNTLRQNIFTSFQKHMSPKILYIFTYTHKKIPQYII